MQVEILLTKDLPEIPTDINTIFDFEEISIMTDEDGILTGMHLILEGTPDSFTEWLKGFPVWVGCGTPQLQQFTKNYTI